MPKPVLKPRILLIEDDSGRIDVFRRWLADTEFVLAVARSGGQALGMLSKGGTEAIAGILLDHDLSDSPFTEADFALSTSDVLPLIVRRVTRAAPVLIHSHNSTKPIAMQRALEASGFGVTRIRFADLDQLTFNAWLDEVRDSMDFPA